MIFVMIKVQAITAQEALMIASSIPGFTLNLNAAPTPILGQSEFILEGWLAADHTINDSRVGIWSQPPAERTPGPPERQ